MAAQPDTTERTATTASPIDRHAAPVTDHDTPKGRHDGRGTAAMIVGIIGILIGLFIPIIGIVLGVIATVLGAVAKRDIAAGRRLGGGHAKAGVILGIVAIAVSIISWIAAAAII